MTTKTTKRTKAVTTAAPLITGYKLVEAIWDDRQNAMIRTHKVLLSKGLHKVDPTELGAIMAELAGRFQDGDPDNPDKRGAEFLAGIVYRQISAHTDERNADVGIFVQTHHHPGARVYDGKTLKLINEPAKRVTYGDELPPGKED